MGLNVSAAEEIESDLGFYVSDMDASAYQLASDGSTYESTDFTYIDASFGSPAIQMRQFTVSSDANIKILLATESLNLNSDHEYNLDFYFAVDYISTSVLYVDLAYYSSQGEELKRQRLDLLGDFTSGNNHYSSDFKPDTSDLSSSYNIRLEIAFMTPNSNTCSWRISNVINLTDKDDNTGWFAKIYNAIIGIGDKIEGVFVSVGEAIVEGIREALEWAFVPSEEFMETYIAEWREWYESNFGVLAQITTFFTDMMEYFNDLITGDYEFVFPEVAVPILDETYVLIEEQTVDMAQWLEDGSFGAELYEIYTTCVWAIIIYLIFKYALTVQDVIYSGTKMVVNTA